jgi:hypothetical protein
MAMPWYFFFKTPKNISKTNEVVFQATPLTDNK